ncbi:conserved hypothetical protein [Trichinella spiralis]|uniref:hypothetical protein n=1 Tax=Trichinella spiralis TaxID=6334 RepID=UPI0001EFD794|nr:conserved hypothetical protein [Trichinella spiralis]
MASVGCADTIIFYRRHTATLFQNSSTRTFYRRYNPAGDQVDVAYASVIRQYLTQLGRADHEINSRHNQAKGIAMEVTYSINFGKHCVGMLQGIFPFLLTLLHPVETVLAASWCWTVPPISLALRWTICLCICTTFSTVARCVSSTSAMGIELPIWVFVPVACGWSAVAWIGRSKFGTWRLLFWSMCSLLTMLAGLLRSVPT